MKSSIKMSSLPKQKAVSSTQPKMKIVEKINTQINNNAVHPKMIVKHSPKTQKCLSDTVSIRPNNNDSCYSWPQTLLASECNPLDLFTQKFLHSQSPATQYSNCISVVDSKRCWWPICFVSQCLPCFKFLFTMQWSRWRKEWLLGGRTGLQRICPSTVLDLPLPVGFWGLGLMVEMAELVF